MELLEGVTVKPREKDRKGEERMGNKEEQEGIRREEVEEVIKGMKEKKQQQKKGKLVAAFIDLKAAFDSVNREKIWEALKREGISEQLRTRIENLYEETRSVVRVKGEKGSCFCMVKGVRQGCPLSAMLFILLLADLEETMMKGQDRGVIVERIKFWTLAYANDIVAITEDKEEIKRTMKRLEKYFDRKKLRVNVGKTKVMRFRKKVGKMKKMEWKWMGEEIKEVKEFYYLGYTFQKNGGQEAHINERVRVQSHGAYCAYRESDQSQTFRYLRCRSTESIIVA
ncbi:uncharacterized protein LOC143893561 [Temnothorax americanus]|uniref:uncharacterized protein LOC143893561 n=1 Tax=Temnothorax americanus TaxID=1964332 RepID=UPI0040695033